MCGKNMSKLPKLRQCPFCGNKEPRFSWHANPKRTWRVECNVCGANGPQRKEISDPEADTFKMAADLWNGEKL